jgi:hypothetical protein
MSVVTIYVVVQSEASYVGDTDEPRWAFLTQEEANKKCEEMREATYDEAFYGHVRFRYTVTPIELILKD